MTDEMVNIEGKMVLAVKVRACRDLYCMKHADHCFACNRPLTVEGKCVKNCNSDNYDDGSED